MEPTSSTITLSWFLFALIVAGIAQGKNRSGLIWFFVSLIIGPVALFLLVAFFSNLPCECPNCQKSEETKSDNNAGDGSGRPV